MNTQPSFFNVSLSKIQSKNDSILDNARIQLLYYGLLLGIASMLAVWASVASQNLSMLTLTAGLLFAAIIGLFKALTWKPYWRAIAHVLLIIATFVNMFDMYFALQTVDVLTYGINILVVLFSFYMLGQKTGFIYTGINVGLMLLFMLLQYTNSYTIDIKPEKLDQSTYIIGMVAMLVLLVFMLNHFYEAFENSIKQLKEKSDEEFALNQKYEVAIDRAEKSMEAKSEFLSTMSHEIRTPLNAVIGMSNLLIMGGPRPDQKENLEVLKFSANNLLSIVNDVLDFNKIESGKLVFENTRFNLVDLMLNICGGQMISAQDKGLEFSLEVDPKFSKKVLFGDPTRITQIIFNLVSNAIKFTPRGNIWVRVACLEDRHNVVTVNFSVRDTGIGIAKENLDVIFEPFTQESVSTTRQYGGTGLGLAIVKRLLEMQGVKIKVASQLSVGSEFSFNMEFPVSTETVVQPLPAAPVANQQPDQAPVQPGSGPENLGTLRVLVAEDNPVNVMLMKKLLSKWSITPSIAENGERAVELVQYGNFDIILMDLQMPVMNGFDATMHIRRMPDPKKAGIPIIALTASALFDIKEKVYESGMNDYVSKPFKPAELFEKITQLTSQSV